MGVILVLAALTILLGRLFMPKYYSTQKEGSLIREYYGEDKDFDVVFIGDCEVYENFVPAVLWEDFGINSYIRGSAQQLIWQSYYLMEETLKYEHPDVMVFNILSLKYNEPQREEYNRMTLDGMRFSKSKVDSILSSMLPDENFTDYLFPLLRFHDRYKELKSEDISLLFGHGNVSHNGYLMQLGVKGITPDNYPVGRMLPDYTFGENAMNYLDKMVELCDNEGVQLVFVKAPSLTPYWYDEWEEQVVAYASEHNIPYINYLKFLPETGIDFTEDTYDMGGHLNLYGAVKLTKHFGEFLRNEMNLPDRRNEEKLSQSWDEKLKLYYAEIETQKAAQSSGKDE